MHRRNTSPQAFALGLLTVATVVAAAARALVAARAAVPVAAPAPPQALPREAARRRVLPVDGVRVPFISLEYARGADLMAYALMMTGLSLVFVAVVHSTAFLLPIGLAWCVAALAVAQLRNLLGSVGTLGFGLAGLGGGADAFAFGIGHFGSVADFAPALFALIGSVAATTFATADLADRAGAPVPRWTSHSAAGLIAAGTLAVALTGVSAIATVAARESVSADARAGAMELAMRDITFAPATIDGAAGEDVRIVVKNDDLIVHTFTLMEAGVDVEIGAGSERLVSFTAPPSGTYTFICDVPGHEAMTGTLAVE